MNTDIWSQDSQWSHGQYQTLVVMAGKRSADKAFNTTAPAIKVILRGFKFSSCYDKAGKKSKR